MEKNENIKVANYTLKQFSEDEVNQYIAELREKARRDDRALFDTGKRIGREEAQKEMEKLIEERIADSKRIGEEQSKEKIAQKLLALNIPIKQISEITELSVEKINSLSQS